MWCFSINEASEESGGWRHCTMMSPIKFNEASMGGGGGGGGGGGEGGKVS